MSARELSVAIVGLGSRGLGVLERIVTLARRAGPDAGPVRVEVVDPTCSGAGVHEPGQPDYLLLNTTAAQVSMFPDRWTVGPDVDTAGPTLYEWATARGLRVAADGCTVGGGRPEPGSRPVRPTDFLPRRVLGDYLGWFLGHLLGRLPGHVRVTLHRGTAVDLDPGTDPDPDRDPGTGDGLLLTLAGGGTLRVDAAFLTTGYPAAPPPVPAGPGADRVIPAPYPLPAAVAAVRPGEVVALGGFGLSALDVVSSLTVGRGGRFVPLDGSPPPGPPGGELRYLPGGREPVLLLHSRSGVPPRARPQLVEFGPAYQPVVFTEAGVDAVRAAAGGPLDFDADVLPLVLAEMRVAYRRAQARLAGGTAERELLDRLAAAATGPFGGPAGVVAVLDRLDVQRGRFDAAALLAESGAPLDSSAVYQDWLVGVVRDDLAEGRLGFAGSPVKAALDVLRALRDTFRYAVDFGGLTAASADEFARRTVPALNRAVVGPQYERHAELLALLAAGVVETPFGPSPAVGWDQAAGRWRVSSTRLAEPCSLLVDRVVAAHVELPGIGRTADPLLAALHRRGLIRRHRPESRHVHGVDVDRDQHPIGADGRPERRLWVLGPLCEGATFYNNLVPSPNTHSRPVFDAHRCVAALLAARTAPVPAPAATTA